MKLELTPFVKLGIESVDSPEVIFEDSDRDAGLTLSIRFSDGKLLEIWPDGNYQVWSPEELLVEGEDVTDVLFAYGSTIDETSALH